MNLDRGMWPEALVAGLASLSVGWPLTTLLQEQTWIARGIIVVSVVVVLGAVLRSVNMLPSLVALAQLLAGMWTLSLMYLGSTLWLGLPTSRTATLSLELLAEAGTVLSEFAAPAPTTTGVSFLVVSVLLLTSVAVDSIGVTNAAPGIAGIPLAAAFLVSVSNNGEPMQPWFFLATATLWLVMVAQQSDRLLAAWPSANRRDFAASRRFGSGYRHLAQFLGASALVGALVAAASLPHMPPTFLGQGLARNADATNLSGGGQVTFTETMDPGEDLRSRSNAVVLEYTSTARSVQPLRVSATSDFDGQRWLAPSRDGTEVQGSQLPPPTGLSPGAVASSEEVAVTVNTLQAPHLAVPVGTTSVSVSPPTVEVNENSQAVLLQSPVEAYSATYDELLPDGEPDPVGPSAQSVSAQDPRLVRVPESGIPAISMLTERIVGDQSDPLTVGRQLQEHFRSTDYTYSLDLGPEQPDAADDPISQFLATKQGYCVQFATAMVMMARSEGIPARMAVGFLPGEVQGDGSRRVVAADAHTWPELYIDGFGWTRFEPTPGARTGLPPQLTQTDTAESTPEQAPEVPETEPETDPEAGSSAPDSTGWDAVVAWFARWRWPIGFGVALVLALTVLPLASRWYRRHEARRRRSAHDHVESQWLLLTQSLADLGVPEPGPKSPRAMQTHYEDRAALDSDSHAALRRMSRRLEQTRYAADPGLDASAPQDMSTDVDVIVGSVRSSASWVSRARAALLPSAGRMAVRQWLHAATSQSTRIQSGGDQSEGDQSGGDQSR